MDGNSSFIDLNGTGHFPLIFYQHDILNTLALHRAKNDSSDSVKFALKAASRCLPFKCCITPLPSEALNIFLLVLPKYQ